MKKSSSAIPQSYKWGYFCIKCGTVHKKMTKIWVLHREHGIRFLGMNPGTNWHVDRAKHLIRSQTYSIPRKGKEKITNALIYENQMAAEESRKRGMNPKRRLSVPEQHQLRIAKDTLRMPDAMVRVMGGPNKAQARQIIKELTGKYPRRNPTKSIPKSLLPVLAIGGLVWWLSRQ